MHLQGNLSGVRIGWLGDLGGQLAMSRYETCERVTADGGRRCGRGAHVVEFRPGADVVVTQPPRTTQRSTAHC